MECACGCGREVTVYNGKPRKFITGHNSFQTGIRTVLNSGIWVLGPSGYVLAHILLAERAVGHRLPSKAVVHHPEHNRYRNNSLVICENHAYHRLLHIRERALKLCGHANWKQCQYCHKFDDPKNLILASDKHSFHTICRRQYQNQYNKRRKKCRHIRDLILNHTFAY
jgi:hypothetical protein